MTHYTFVQCTGPIEGKEGMIVAVRHKGQQCIIFYKTEGWYWFGYGPGNIPVTEYQWPHIEILTQSPSTPILGAEEVLREIMDDDRTVASIIQAMQAHSAQYAQECERLREGLVECLQMMEQTMAYRKANGITAGNTFLQSTIDKAKQLLNL